MEKFLLSGDMLNKVVPRLNMDRAAEIAGAFNRVSQRYGITTADIYHEFLANVLVECRAFRSFEEDLYYSGERLLEVWPDHFADLKTAKAYERNPAKLANFIYGPATSIGRKLGNKLPTDGFDFRGGGCAHLTGRGIYTAYAAWAGLPSPEEAARLVRSELVYAVDSAAWFFSIEKKLIPAAIADDLITVCKRWNGGTNGLADRKLYYARCVKFIR